jgi:D-alanine-D-alanine ligase-like ATP-grasp enzyme
MKRIAVLRGGPSSEYDVSLLSGGAVLKSLRELNYPHKDIIISKKGEWLESGMTRTPDSALEAVDVVSMVKTDRFSEYFIVKKFLLLAVAPCLQQLHLTRSLPNKH